MAFTLTISSGLTHISLNGNTEKGLIALGKLDTGLDAFRTAGPVTALLEVLPQ